MCELHEVARIWSRAPGLKSAETFRGDAGRAGQFAYYFAERLSTQLQSHAYIGIYL